MRLGLPVVSIPKGIGEERLRKPKQKRDQSVNNVRGKKRQDKICHRLEHGSDVLVGQHCVPAWINIVFLAASQEEGADGGVELDGAKEHHHSLEPGVVRGFQLRVREGRGINEVAWVM